MAKWKVFQQLAPRRKVVNGVEEWEPRLVEVGMIDGEDARAAMDAARQAYLVFRLGYQKSSLHSRPVVEKVKP